MHQVEWQETTEQRLADATATARQEAEVQLAAVCAEAEQRHAELVAQHEVRRKSALSFL
jgi:hypothetical protein|eukprot:COSAG05_NODE_6147_length_1013_cov_0.791028_2_plen_59_part_00